MRRVRFLMEKSVAKCRIVTGEVHNRKVSSQIPLRREERSIVGQSMVEWVSLFLLKGDENAARVSCRICGIRSGLKTR